MSLFSSRLVICSIDRSVWQEAVDDADSLSPIPPADSLQFLVEDPLMMLPFPLLTPESTLSLLLCKVFYPQAFFISIYVTQWNKSFILFLFVALALAEEVVYSTTWFLLLSWLLTCCLSSNFLVTPFFFPGWSSHGMSLSNSCSRDLKKMINSVRKKCLFAWDSDERSTCWVVQ